MQNNARFAQPVLLQEAMGQSLPQGLLLPLSTLVQTLSPFAQVGVKPICQHATSTLHGLIAEQDALDLLRPFPLSLKRDTPGRGCGESVP